MEGWMVYSYIMKSTRMDRVMRLPGALCGRPGVFSIRRSAIEYEPTDFVSQTLIVQNKIANRIRQLLTLPLTLQTTCLVPVALNNGCPCSLDGISGCA